ncbi:MAG: DNA translocase FtsK [Planctomycetota bacterium]
MTGLSMAEQQQGEQRMRAFVPLLPVMVSTFFVVALIWYRLQVLPSYTSTFEGNWLASSVAWLHASIGFLPAFLTAVLGLAWSSLWFFTGPIERPKTRVGYLVVFAICLSIVEGVGSEGSATLGSFVATRLENVFGTFLTSLLAISASLFAFLLASDFCFFRYFEGVGFFERRRPATKQSKVLDVEIETAAVSELMARPAAVDGATPPANSESGGIAVAEPPASDEPAAGVEERVDEIAELEEAAGRAQQYVEDHGFDDPLSVDGPGSEIEEAAAAGVAEPAVDSDVESASDSDAPGEDELNSLFGELDDWTPPEPGSESMAGEFEEGVPTIVDIGLSSVEIPIVTGESEAPVLEGGLAEEAIADAEDVENEVPVDPADSVDDLSVSVALREAGFLGQNTDEADRDLSENVEGDELNALLGAADALGLEADAAESVVESESSVLENLDSDNAQLEDSEAASEQPEVQDRVHDEPVVESPVEDLDRQEVAPAASDQPQPEPAPDAANGWLFPSVAEGEMVEEAELVDEEFDDLVSEAESLAREVHELASRTNETEIEPEPEEPATEVEPAFEFDDSPGLGSGPVESSLRDSGEAEAAVEPAQGALFAPVTDDDLLAEAEELVRSTGRASVGLLARRLRIEFEHADTVLARLEERGIVAIDDETGRVSVLGD